MLTYHKMLFSSPAHKRLAQALADDDVDQVHSILGTFAHPDTLPLPIFTYAQSIEALRALFRYYKPTGRRNLGWRPEITIDNRLQHEINWLLLDNNFPGQNMSLDKVREYIKLVLDQGANPNQCVCTSTHYDIAKGSYFAEMFRQSIDSPGGLAAATVMVEYGGADVHTTWGECNECSIGTRLWQFSDFPENRDLLVARLDFIDACVAKGFVLPDKHHYIRHAMIRRFLKMNTLGPFTWLCAMLRPKQTGAGQPRKTRKSPGADTHPRLPTEVVRLCWSFLMRRT
jgi:hypothetical protein